jgi:hypothetical protein
MNKLISVLICLPTVLLGSVSPTWAQFDSSANNISDFDLTQMTNCIGDIDNDGDVDGDDFEAYRREIGISTGDSSPIGG